MKSYSQAIFLFFYRMLIALSMYAITRFIFLVFNTVYFLKSGLLPILSTFWYGLLFDTSTFIYFNLLFVVFSLFPFISKSNHWYQRMLAILFYIGNGVVLFLNLIDAGYFPFSSKRSGIELFAKKSEGGHGIIIQYILDFWYLFLLWIVLVVLLIWLYGRKKYFSFFISIQNKFISFFSQIIVFGFLVGLAVLGARGGMYLRPLRSVDASRFVDPSLIPLVLNTPFQIISTSESQAIRSYHWMNKKQELQLLNPIKKFEGKKQTKKNVVIIILESFGREYVGFYNKGIGYTPFLDSLSTQSLVFTRAYANGKTSMDGIPAILSSISFIDHVSFITSPYQTNTITSVAKELRKKGYETAFYHGGKNGTMGFNSYATLAGFENYYGLNEYPFPNEYDGFWGIPDYNYLNYVGNQLQHTQQPFCISVFTLSSHHPYLVPDAYKDKFPKGTLPIHATIGYTDFSLRNFFNQVKKSDWYTNTVFIITADHSAENETSYYSSLTGKYLIPFLIFDPSQEIKGISSKVTQQLDIMPSILDYVGYDQSFYSLGNSVFKNNNSSWAFQFDNGLYQFIEWPYSILFDGENWISLYKLDEDSLSTNNLIGKNKLPIIDSIQWKLKSFLQQYSEALHQNKMDIKN